MHITDKLFVVLIISTTFFAFGLLPDDLRDGIFDVIFSFLSPILNVAVSLVRSIFTYAIEPIISLGSYLFDIIRSTVSSVFK